MNYKKILNYILRLLFAPFSSEIAFFIICFLLMSTIDSYLWLKRGYWVYWVYICASNFVCSYIITLPLSILKYKYLKYIYLVIALSMLLWFALVDYFYNFIYYGGFYMDCPEIVKNTNLNEAIEFIHTIMTPVSWVISLSLIFFPPIAYFLLHKYLKIDNRIVNVIGAVSLILCIVLGKHNPGAYQEAFIGKMHIWYMSFTQKSPDYKAHFSDPGLTYQKSGLPTKLVVILGESFSKFHSSLYGYEKETNPLLGMRSPENLHIFRNVESPDINTLSSFQKFISDYRGDEDSRKWEECLTIYEILNKVGYHSTWISSQAHVGLIDNPIGSYADLFDETIFTRDLHGQRFKALFDEELLPIVDSIHQNHSSNKLETYWIHLIGSHLGFNERYPEGRGHFIADDYNAYPENQHTTLAHCDNAILYNDYIVNCIFDIFNDDDAVIIYFSDHGLDIYYSDPSYCYYGKKAIPKSYQMATQIPFIIFTTDQFNQNNPELKSRIDRSLDNPFNTIDLIYLIMDICGIQMSDNDAVQKYSPLS